MNNFEKPKNLFNENVIKGVDQLTSKEEAITVSEKKELLRSNISELKYNYSLILSELEKIIDELEDGNVNDVIGQELAKEKNESLNQVANYLEIEKKKLSDMKDYSEKLKKSLLFSKN